MVHSKSEARELIWEDWTRGLITQERADEQLRGVARRDDLPETTESEALSGR